MLDGLERNGDAVAKVTARFADDVCIADGSLATDDRWILAKVALDYTCRIAN